MCSFSLRFGLSATVSLMCFGLSAQLAKADAAAQPVDVDEIIITGRRPATDYAAKTSAVFGLSPLDIQDIPQSVQVLTEGFIRDTGALSLAQLFQNVPGASNFLARTTPFGAASLQLRGQDAVVFRDGLRDVDFSDIDQSALNTLSRVDILKGPAGLVYGTGGAGGVVNLITKRPLEEFYANVTASFGTRDTKIVTGDVSAALGAGFGIRVTGELERSDSFIDFSEIERDNFSAVVSYTSPDDRLEAAVIYENFANRDDNAMTRVGLPSGGTIVEVAGVEIDRSTYLGEPEFDFTDSYGNMLTLELKYQFSDVLRAQFAGRRTRVNFDQAETRTLSALDPETLTVTRTRARELVLDEEQYNARGFVGADFTTGSIQHDLIVGAEYYEIDVFIDNRSVPNDQVPDISVVNPTYLDQPLTTGTPFVFDTFRSFTEIFAQDVVRAGNATITGAVRHIWSDFTNSFGLDESLSDTLFQIGGSYALSDTVSVFTGYNTGYDANAGLAEERSRTGEQFDPERYNQIELGLKVSELEGVTATFSIFSLNREGILVDDPQDAAFLVQVGEERSRGFEADILYSPTDAIDLRFGYLFLDTEVTEDTDITRIGNQRPGAPRHRANAFASYSFQEGFLRNLRVNASISYVGSAQASISNAVERPSYTVVDLGASYAIDRFRIDAFLANAFDERYFLARNDLQVNQGEPRLFRIRGSVTF
ncbi:MAG: TonB-dependent siderophore receptor [Pseudomonadota bacterium]